MADKMLIILTTGPEDRGNRATLAFAMGVSSVISGVDTTIYITMGGAFWSRVKSVAKVRIDGFEPLSDYVGQFTEGGGKLMLCSPCNEFYCSIEPEKNLLPGTELCGLGHVVDLAMSSSVVTL